MESRSSFDQLYFLKEGMPKRQRFINFEIASLDRPFKFAPNALGVRQGQDFLNIESLYVDSLELLPQRPVKGTLVLNVENRKASLVLVFALPGKSKKKRSTGFSCQ